MYGVCACALAQVIFCRKFYANSIGPIEVALFEELLIFEFLQDVSHKYVVFPTFFFVYCHRHDEAPITIGS